MKIIPISGEIGWDVWPGSIRRQFDQANGEDVELQISSPGGFIIDGIEIFNIVKNSTSNVTVKIIGLAASMASYIAMAGDKVVVESNAVFMIHNAWGFTAGDHNELRHTADILEGFTGLLAKKYAAKSGKSVEDIRSLMDAESWYFGSEIVEAGFADEVVNVEGENAVAKSQSLIEAKASFKVLSAKLKKEEREGDLEKIAAMLPKGKLKNSGSLNQGVTPKNIKIKKEVKMTLEELKAQHPDEYAQIFALGQKAEASRVSGHATMAKETGAYEYAMECIGDSSKSVKDDDVYAKYMAAGMKKKDLKDRVKDNPKDSETEPDTEKTDEEKLSDKTKKIGNDIRGK